MTRSEAMPIGEFLTELSSRLDRLGPAGVRAALESYGRSLRPSQRSGLLDVFAVGDGPVGSAADDLLDEIERFTDELRDLEPPTWDRYRSWRHGDDDDEYVVESGELDGLLVEVGERFLAGDVEVAATGYERLLDAVVETVDNDGASLSPDADLLAESLARLLWCLIRAAPERVADALDRYGILTPVPSVAALLGAHPDLGPPADGALRAAAGALLAKSTGGPEWESRTRLALALALQAHVDGLESVLPLARMNSPQRLEVSKWVVHRLVDEGRIEEAATIAHETLGALGNSPALARLADAAAALDTRLGRPAFGAAERAWQADPTIGRLEAALDAASAEEHERFLAALAARPPADRLLATATSILAGDVRGAAERVIDGKAWDRQRIAVQLAVAACCAVATPSPVARVPPAITAACASAIRREPPFDQAEPAADRTPLGQRLQAALATVARDAAYLAIAKGLVHGTVEAILGDKARSQYALAAELIVLLADASEAVDGTPASEMVGEYERRYNRFSAFRTELRAAG